MKKIYLFRKGGKFNPIKTNKEWRNFVFNHKNCYMYILDDKKVTEYLDVWQKMKKDNIEMKIINKK